LYVSQIERDEFETQLDKIVDDIFTEYQYKFKSFFPDNKKKKDILKTVIYGIIAQSKIVIEEKTVKENQDIDNKNGKIVMNSIYTVLFYMLLCFIVLFILHYMGYPLNIKDNLKESLFVLFFVFIIEITFLNLIAKHYMSGNANYVTKSFTQKIIEYIDKNNLI